MTMQFTAKARRDGRWWVVQCDQHPNALSQVARLDQASAHQREAISMVTGLTEEEIEVEVVPVLDTDLLSRLSEARANRVRAECLQREASTTVAQVAGALLSQGLSMRDIGTVLGVSHQRVAQLVRQRSA